jgi:hypothetical protein
VNLKLGHGAWVSIGCAEMTHDNIPGGGPPTGARDANPARAGPGL